MRARLLRVRRPPLPGKPLKYDARGVPIPSTKLMVRDTGPSTLADHYHYTLRDDLMYMTYVHEPSARKPPRDLRPTYDPADPYTKFRYNPPVGGSRIAKTPPPPSSSDNVVRLEKICLHSFQDAAISNKSALLGPLMAFRAISGLTEEGGGRKSSEGVQIVRGRKNVGGWIRPGIAAGVRVDLKGDRMYDFLGSLVRFVLPRLRDFEGIPLAFPGKTTNIPSAATGVVSFGLPPEAMGFFPEIEVNQDAYPNTYGMHIHFVTNATGIGAQDKARALLSGYQLPFKSRS
ncbi:mitochondrial 50S ribosomal protein L5 [Rickenella mellea]|uniref:Mitochondrial 50S ribosomal protein L5 n=1 Tax=Rickenella mellea TaxID=50990 RepID=A0A4Y7Q5P9_9AGAM|nr:mitochondrial 50S ribosomal protein L5 [Rickenella mellea]